MDKIEMVWYQNNSRQKNQETQWVQGKDSCWMASSETTWGGHRYPYKLMLIINS